MKKEILNLQSSCLMQEIIYQLRPTKRIVVGSMRLLGGQCENSGAEKLINLNKSAGTLDLVALVLTMNSY